MSKKLCCALILGLFMIACQKKQDEDSSPLSSSSRTPSLSAPLERAATATPSAANSAGADVDLPEDFAEDANEEVTAANVIEQVGIIEKELENSERRQ